MDVFEVDGVKVEKVIAMRRYKQFRRIAGVFRCVEVFVGFLLLAWLSLRLPVAVKISGEFLRQLAAVVVSPVFVFLVGNAIVITLFAKSGRVGRAGGEQLYDEFVKSSEGRGAAPRQSCEEEAAPAPAPAPVPVPVSQKELRRSKSEPAPAGTMPEETEGMQKQLRRSETEGRRESSYSEAEMSDEEFNRTIERFIAKQLKFQREESMAVVLHAS